MSMKNSNETIENQTRDLPACSAVPQPTAPPRAPINVKYCLEICIEDLRKAQIYLNKLSPNLNPKKMWIRISLFSEVSLSTPSADRSSFLPNFCPHPLHPSINRSNHPPLSLSVFLSLSLSLSLSLPVFLSLRLHSYQYLQKSQTNSLFISYKYLDKNEIVNTHQNHFYSSRLYRLIPIPSQFQLQGESIIQIWPLLPILF